MNSFPNSTLLLFAIVLALCHMTQGLTTIKSEFIDCFSEEDSPQDNSQKSDFDCKAINPHLANCTCIKDYIDCSNRNFFSVPSDFTKMPGSITRLLFAKNQINSLGKIQLSPQAKVSVIDLRKNKISAIDAGFFSEQLAASLDYLNMCGNVAMDDFNAVKANFTKLSWLELNHIVEPLEIKQSFFNKERFPNLMHLSLNHVGLKFTKRPFDRLDKLEVLRLDSNKLTQLPCDSLLEMMSLTSLNLNNNILSKNPDISQDCLKNSMDLQELYLQANEMSEDSLEWMNMGQFKKLDKLDLSVNKFDRIPYKALNGLTSLRSLKISIDEVVFSTPVLGSGEKMLLPGLEYLDLTGSSIKKIGNNSFELISTNLMELILKSSHLQILEADAFNKLDNLIFLDLSHNQLKTLHKPSSIGVFNYDLLRGNVNLTYNSLDCSSDIEWFMDFYDYDLFDNSVTCYLINGTRIPVREFIDLKREPMILPEKKNNYNVLAIILLVLIVLVVSMGVVYIFKRKQMKQRQQQYRYRYFTERSQDDGFDTDNVPVYRDCTVSLKIKDTDDAANVINNNASSSAVLTETRNVIIS